MHFWEPNNQAILRKDLSSDIVIMFKITSGEKTEYLLFVINFQPVCGEMLFIRTARIQTNLASQHEEKPLTEFYFLLHQNENKVNSRNHSING